MLDQFSRSRIVLGEEAINKLKDSRVIIFGIGGVGSFVAEGLVRCGVGHFILVDNDKISLTNVNRQIHATLKTVGQSKTKVMAERMRDINPEVEIREINEFYLPDNRDIFFEEEVDYIVDAIDTVTSKIDIAIEATRRQIPVISSMGAANKFNPAELEVADIYQTSVDPLAKVMRYKLKRNGVKKLKVVYSKEKPTVPQYIEGQMEKPTGSRHTTPGSVSFVPSVAGMIIASEVIKDIVGINKKKK